MMRCARRSGSSSTSTSPVSRLSHQPSWRAVLAYDATRMLLGALASALPVGGAPADTPARRKAVRDAVAALDGSAALREAFGDEVVEHYLRAARWEQSEFDRRVTDWELARYFERI